MPELRRAASWAIALALLALVACSHGNDQHNNSGPRTNIDLTVTGFSVAPDTSDTEDLLTLTGTIQNIGIETANPLPGDFFTLRFNLSLDGTFELNEQGFLEQRITDPIPPGGSVPFAYSAPFGNGDTQSIFGNFCSTLGCVPPEPGVIGVKADAQDGIKELDEGNNFQFLIHQVVGTRVAATFTGCDFGTLDPAGTGCNLTVSDGLYSVTLHRPCSNCGSANDIVLPNELHRTVSVMLQLKGCDRNQTPSGTCGGSWTITGETQKPGLPISKIQNSISCLVTFADGGPNKLCSTVMEIRDANY